MVKTVAVGAGRVFVGALKVLRFSAWSLPQIAFWSALICLSNLCALAFSIRLHKHYLKIQNEDYKIKDWTFIIASALSWFTMGTVLFFGLMGYSAHADFRSKVNLFLSAASLPIPFTGLGIPFRYILYTLLATNLVSFFYEIGRLGKKSDAGVKPDDNEKTEQGDDLFQDFLELMEDINSVEEMTRELAEKWRKKIENALKEDKIDLNEACNLKTVVDNKAHSAAQRLVVDGA